MTRLFFNSGEFITLVNIRPFGQSHGKLNSKSGSFLNNLESCCLSPFAHETLLQCGVLSPGSAFPSEAPLSVDPRKQRDPGQGGMLPVD